MPTIDQIIRSRRKTIALIITREGKLVVRAPLRASRAQIDALVAEKSVWIQAHQAAMLARPQAPAHRFIAGESFAYLGQAYPLRITSDGKRGLELRAGQFVLAAQAAGNARGAFVSWYRRQARAVLAERVARHAARLGYHPGPLRISSARSRWGSCSHSGTLSFTWRLVLAPLEVIDYVVVHELVHLKVKNHSRDFWQAVAMAYPGYTAARKWLKENNELGAEFLDL